MRKMKRWVWGLVAIGVLGGVAWWWTQSRAADQPVYRTAKLERGPLLATVAASGAVNPVTQVSVGFRMSDCFLNTTNSAEFNKPSKLSGFIQAFMDMLRLFVLRSPGHL